jgi:hypothetical protein
VRDEVIRDGADALTICRERGALAEAVALRTVPE